MVYDGEDVWLKESEETLESCLTLMFDPELGDCFIWLFCGIAVGVNGDVASDVFCKGRLGIGG